MGHSPFYFTGGRYVSHFDLFGNAPQFGAQYRGNQRKRRKLERQTGRKKK